MNYFDSASYMLSPITESERVCSGAGVLCKAMLSLKNICSEYSGPGMYGRHVLAEVHKHAKEAVIS